MASRGEKSGQAQL